MTTFVPRMKAWQEKIKNQPILLILNTNLVRIDKDIADQKHAHCEFHRSHGN